MTDENLAIIDIDHLMERVERLEQVAQPPAVPPAAPVPESPHVVADALATAQRAMDHAGAVLRCSTSIVRKLNTAIAEGKAQEMRGEVMCALAALDAFAVAHARLRDRVANLKSSN